MLATSLITMWMTQGLLEPLGGGGTALVTTLQAKLSAHNENRMGRVGELEAGDRNEP